MHHAALAIVVCSSSALAQGAATQLISATSAGATASGGAMAISPEGRYVVFGSYSPQIVAGDVNATWDVFVRDRVSGAVEVVSQSSTGAPVHPLDLTQLRELGAAAACSSDARFVAFTSSAPDVVPGDTNDAIDVFVRDRVLGTTVRASDGAGGVQSDNHAALAFVPATGAIEFYAPGISLSHDGRYLAFGSSATNLVAGDTNLRHDVFVRDLQAGAVERISVSTGGAQADADSMAPSISADGRFVAFQSLASNLVAGDTNLAGDVFVRDRLLGTTELASVSTAGAQGNGHSSWYVQNPPCHGCGTQQQRWLECALSADGRHVAFSSWATNLDPGAVAVLPTVYVRDLDAGTTRSATPLANAAVTSPRLSANGRFVALLSAATNLGPIDANPEIDVYRVDLALGTVTLESVDSFGVQQPGESFAVVLADDGEQLALTSEAQLSPAPPQPFAFDTYARNAPAHSFADDCEGTLATCPCANAGASGHGCASSAVAAGARLIASGRPSVSADSLVLTSSGEPTSATTIFLQAATSSPSASALTLGDGVLCLTGSFVRLHSRAAQHGVAQLGVSGDARLSSLGSIPTAGATMHYQVVYRNAANFCTSATSNTSNSIAVSWLP